MPHQNKGAILITTLIIVFIMTALITQLYQTLIMNERLITADWHSLQSTEMLRKKTRDIINLPHWSAQCLTKKMHSGNGCKIGKFHYIIESKYPSYCSIVFTQGHWRDALFYHIWVWKDNQSTTYFTRVVKAAQKLTCLEPRARLKSSILSESIIATKFNI